MSKYASHPGHACPRCGSPAPHLHPAVQAGGEVQVCPHEYHLIPTNQNRTAYAQTPDDLRQLCVAAE